MVAVAYSGGRDSTALLHATLAAAAGTGVVVVALHVHHGLSPNADAWLLHCREKCRRWTSEGRALRFDVRQLTGAPVDGPSVEAWARTHRYAALTEMARGQGATLVLLAHHRQDQAETWMLQALRGGGVAGLAAMPQAARRDGICWLRPWLHRSRADLAAYLVRHRLSWIEDESNADPRFARNRLRAQTWPSLQAAFPGAEAALAQAATWAQEATAALAELAQIDLAEVGTDDALLLDRWRLLSAARRSNCLRAWLAARCRRPVAAGWARRLTHELPSAAAGRWPLAGGELRLHRGALRFVALPSAARGPAACAREAVLAIDRDGSFPLAGWHGSLRVCRVAEGGVPLAWLKQVELRARSGGERFQAGIGRPPRSLKKQFQEAGVARWDRDGPLIFSAGQLVYVPGLGLDARVLGMPGQPLVTLQWLAHPATEPAAGAG